MAKVPASVIISTLNEEANIEYCLRNVSAHKLSGKPIIYCSVGQSAKYVKETCSGIMVKPRDYEALAEAVLYLKNNSDIARKLGDSGRWYVEDNLSIENIGEKMMAVFYKVLRQP